MRKITILLCSLFLVFNSCEKDTLPQEDTINQEKSNRNVIKENVTESRHSYLGGGFIEVVLEDNMGRKPGVYLYYNCKAPIHFQLDSQEPCEILNVNSETGRLSLLNGGTNSGGLCGNYDEDELRVHYSVTDVSGEIESYFFKLTTEDFIILELEED